MVRGQGRQSLNLDWHRHCKSHSVDKNEARQSAQFGMLRESGHGALALLVEIAMTRRLQPLLHVKKGLRAISFHAGVGVGLAVVGMYLAVVSRHWLAAVALLVAAMLIASIPLRLPRVRR